MFRKKSRFKSLMQLLLAAAAVCTAELQGGPAMTPPPAKESPELAGAQYRYGVYCKEKLKDDAKAYRYLELAAKQNFRPAWLFLADCYLARVGEHPSYLTWAKLCLQAAEKLKADPETEFRIAMAEAGAGNFKGFEHWMKLAAGKGNKKAAQLLADPKVRAGIEKINSKKSQKKSPPALKRSIDSHLAVTRKLLGTTGPEVLDKLAGRPEISKTAKMLTLPLPEGSALPGWKYDPDAVEAMIDKKLMADRESGMRWITEEFLAQPIWENLLYPNPTIRAINAAYEDELYKSLSASSFRRCSAAETKKLIKPFMDPAAPKTLYDDDMVWELSKGIYFRIHLDSSGRWMMRYYSFFIIRDGKSIEVETFSAPPGAADTALAAGLIKGDPDCWNNLAVKYAEGEMDFVFRHDEKVEAILRKLVSIHHTVGTWNLGVFYLNQGKKEEAKKYFLLAAKYKEVSPRKK